MSENDDKKKEPDFNDFNDLHITIEDLVDEKENGTDNDGVENKTGDLNETIKKEFITEAKRSRSRNDWSDLVILATALNSINKTLDDINNLMTKYRDIEKDLVVRVYPKFLIQSAIIKPKTLIGGKDRFDIILYYESFKAYQQELKDYIERVSTIKVSHISEIRKMLYNFFNKELVDSLKDEQIFSMITLMFIIEANGVRNIHKESEDILRLSNLVCDEKNIRFELPKLSAVEIAKDFRDTLMSTQSVGRQAEIFFTFYFGKLLYQHPQIRKDYSDVEKYTNALFQSLVVTSAEIDLDGKNVSDAIKKIMKSLRNITGDFNALRLVLSMNVKKTRKVSSIDDWLENMIRKKDKRST
jgi:hypothetical protein